MNAFSVLVMVLGLALTGCGGGGGSGGSPQPNPPPTVSPPPQTRLATSPAFSALRFDEPLAMTQAPGDSSRWYVVERAGRIWVFDNNPQVQNASLFLDISTRVESGANEAGLLGLAFHPNFASNGELILSYTRNIVGLESVVSRLRSLDGGVTAEPASEQVLLTVAQDFTNHNGGNALFGPDGFLYVGFGDGGSGDDPNNRSQDPSNLLGTILRLDVDGSSPYEIPADNPFAGNARCVGGFGGASCPEIFAYGLRNPWRFSFDRATDTLWAGDVGQDRFEEINRVTAGANYGWRIREASQCNIPATGCNTNGLTDPVTEYDHDLGSSVTGGFVYRGTEVGLLQDTYVFGDFVSGRIFGVADDASQGSPAEELLDTDFNISSFSEDSDGELYLIDYSSGGIHRLIEE